MVLGEAITFDPGEVILLLTVLAAIAIVGLAVLVVGIVAGYRSGRYPERTRAHVAWVVCAVLQAVVFVLTLLGGVPASWRVATLAVLATSLLARWYGRSQAERDAPVGP